MLLKTLMQPVQIEERQLAHVQKSDKQFSVSLGPAWLLHVEKNMRELNVVSRSKYCNKNGNVQ